MLLPGFPIPGLANVAGDSLSVTNDPFWQSVVFQSTFTGANGSTSATDDSLPGHTITFVGNAQINGNELLLDGTGDYISCADSADFNIQSAQNGQWTIELDITADTKTPSDTAAIIGQYNITGDQRSWVVAQLVNGDISLLTSETGAAATIVTIVPAADYSAATKLNLKIAFDGETYYAAKDGTILTNSSGGGAYESLLNSTSQFRVGDWGSGGNGFAGKVDNPRLTKGAARFKGSVSDSITTDGFGDGLTFGESGRSSVTYVASGTTTSPTIPSTSEIGDMAIAAVFHRNATLTPPSGWTLIGSTSGTGSGATNYTSLYRKTLASGEPGSAPTWTQGGAGRMAVQIVTFRKSGGLSVIDSATASQNNDTTDSNQHEMAVATATANNQIGVVATSFVLSAAGGAPTTVWPVNSATTPWTMTSPFDVVDNRLCVAWRIMSNTETTEGYFTTNDVTGTGSNGVASVSAVLG